MHAIALLTLGLLLAPTCQPPPNDARAWFQRGPCPAHAELWLVWVVQDRVVREERVEHNQVVEVNRAAATKHLYAECRIGDDVERSEVARDGE